ncbi:MAG: Gfo/Idh/MocA family oxidoreductase [Caldilineaceae bacterium]|nr:Gfo/Idh/MocA family oxidoreductase [Caldilineaceae bacterium]
MQRVKIGAIGYGYWGPNLIRNFVELPGSELYAVADLDEERLQHVRERHPQIRITTSNYTELFHAGLDAVVVATPPHTHYRIVRQCLENGLHVLVEKPLTLNSEEGCELIRIAEQHNRVLMVGHTFEYNPAVRVLKAMIDSGELGEIQYIDAVRVSLGLFNSHLNVIWDLAPHDISILLHLLGDMPLTVAAQGTACVQEGIEDVAYMTMRFPNNILAHIRMSWLDPCKTRRITVVGSKKMVIYDDVEPQEKIKVYDKGVKAIRHTDTYGEFQFAYHYGDIVSPYIRFEEPLRVECGHFLACIQQGDRPLTDGYNGLRVVEIVEAAQRSLRNGGGAYEFQPHFTMNRTSNGDLCGTSSATTATTLAVNGTTPHPVSVA